MDKYKKLVSNTVIFAIGSFGAKFLSFFLVRLYTGVMSEAEYGIADLLYQTVNIIYPLVTLAMADAVIRFGVDKGYSNTKVYSAALFVTTAGCIVLALLSPIFNLVPEFYGYTFFLYAACMFSCIRQITSSFVRARGQVKLFALDGILATFTTVVFNVIFLLGFGFGVKGYILSIICSDILSVVFLYAAGGVKSAVNFRGIFPVLALMLRYSAPLVPTYILWWITGASDRWFVITMIGEAQNGVYSAAYKIPTLLMMFTTLFFQAWQLSVIENKDDSELPAFYSSIWRAYSALLFVGACGLIWICKPLTDILVDTNGKDFGESYKFCAILIVATAFQCACQFLTSVYNVKKKSANACLTALVAAGVNVLLNFLLIPLWGVPGAAIATAAAYFVCFAVRLVDCRRLIPFSPHAGRMTVNFIFAGAAAVICFFDSKIPHAGWILLSVTVLMMLINIRAVGDTVKKILHKDNGGNVNGTV
jgi:O-antigen/teichoic acid export membrane protein